MDELLDSLMAPSFFYDLSADAVQGAGALSGLDDSFFDVEHPLHETGWPLEPPRSLIIASPGGPASPAGAELLSANVSPVRGAPPPYPPPSAPRAGEKRTVCSPMQAAASSSYSSRKQSMCGGGTRPAPARTQKRSTGAAGLQTPVERQAERAMRGRRIESPGATKLRAAGGKAAAGRGVGAPPASAAPAVDEDRETRNLLAELEMHNKKIVAAGRLAARERVKQTGGGIGSANGTARAASASGSLRASK